MATRKAARKRSDQWVEDPEYGTLLELEPIDVEGSVSRANAIELEPIDIQGSRSADVQPFTADEGFVPGAQPPPRRADGVSTMLPDFVPSWVTDVTGQPVRGMGGTTDYEIPEWAAEFVAGSEGQMPRDSFDVATALTANLIPGYLPYRMLTGTAPTPESRTVSPEAAALGVAEGGSLGFADEIAGLLDDEAADEYRRERATTQRQNPGSFAMGDAAGGTALGLVAPAASAGRGATTLARGGLAALEGGAYGLLEGVGRSDADTLSGRLEDAIPGTVGGAVLGGGLGAGSRYMEQRAARPVDDIEVEALLDRAAWHHLSQAGADQSQARQRMMTRGDTVEDMTRDARRLVEQMRAREVLPPAGSYFGRSQEAIQNDTARIGREGVSRIQREVAPAMEAQEISTAPITEAIDAEIERLSRDPTMAGVVARLRTWREGYGSQPTVTWRQYQDWKNQLGRLSDYTQDDLTPRGITYGAVTNAMQDAVDRTQPDLGPTYQRAREDARLGYVVGENAASDARREGRVRVVSPTDYMAGMGGGLAGVAALFSDAVQGAGAGGLGAVATAGVGLLANRAFRAREHAMQAGRLERAAQRLQTAPERFGRYAGMLRAAQERGPQAFAAALYIAQQNDASVRAAVADEEDTQQMRDEGQRLRTEREAADAAFAEPATDAELDALFQ